MTAVVPRTFVLATLASLSLTGCTVHTVPPEPPAFRVVVEAVHACPGAANGSLTAVVQPETDLYRPAEDPGPGEYSYAWNDPAAQTTATAADLAPGAYAVTVTDRHGRSVTGKGRVEEMTVSVLKTRASAAGRLDGSATATPFFGQPPYTYQWTDARHQTSATAEGLGKGTYMVMVRDARGCVSSATAVINDRDYALAQPVGTEEGIVKRQPVIHDRFGNVLRPEDLVIPQNSVIAGHFRLHFFDDDNNTDSGFDEPGVGAERRQIVAQVFRDLSILLGPVPRPYPCLGPEYVDIRITSGTIIDNGVPLPAVIGVASSYYIELGNGISDGEVWKVLNTGIDSSAELAGSLIPAGDIYHGYMQINFTDHDLYDDFQQIDPFLASQQDLYSVALHEATHALGFASLIDAAGDSRLTASNPGRYSRFDTLLRTAAGTAGSPLIDIPGCYDPTFNTSFLGNLTTCGQVYFVGPNNSPGSEVYSPPTFSSGSSLSHYNCPGPQAGFVMNAGSPPGPGGVNRTYHLEETATLCDLGYDLTGTFADGSFVPVTPYPTCNASSCLVRGGNDFRPFSCDNSGNDYEVEAGKSITIDGADILANDNNADQMTCLELVAGRGDVDDNFTDFTYTAPANFAGTAIIKYTPRNSTCGTVGNSSYIFIEVTPAELPPCPENSCELICHGDLEAQAITQEVLPLSDFRITDSNSPDLYAWDSSVTRRVASGSSSNSFGCGGSQPNPDPAPAGGNQFAGLAGFGSTVRPAIGNIEALHFPLTRPLDRSKNCNLTFWAAAKSLACTPTLQVLGSVNRPCDASEATQVTGATDCTSPATQFLPIPLGSQVIGSTQWTQYTVPIPAGTLSTDINHLVVYPQPTSTYVFVDNFSLTCDGTTPLVIIPAPSQLNPCVGDTVTVDYQVCLDQNATPPPTSNTQPIDVTIDLPPDLSIAGGPFAPNGTATLPAGALTAANPCVTLRLVLGIDGTAVLGVPLTVDLTTGQSSCISTSSQSVTTTLVPGGRDDLSVTKSVDGPTLVAPGDLVTFDVEICNSNPNQALGNVLVEDLLPAGLTLVSSQDFADLGGGVLNATAATVLSRSCETLSFTARVGASCAELDNCARILSADGLCSPPPGSCAAIQVNPKADGVTLKKSLVGSPASVKPGDRLTYQLEICTPPGSGVTTLTVEDAISGFGFDLGSVQTDDFQLTFSRGVVVLENDSLSIPAGECATLEYSAELRDPVFVCAVENCAEIREVDGCPASIRECLSVDVEALKVDLGPDRTVCPGEQIDLEAGVDGGSGPYDFAWSSTPSDPTLVATAGSASASPTASTTYEVEVTDSNGCSATGSVDFTVSIGSNFTLEKSVLNPGAFRPGDPIFYFIAVRHVPGTPPAFGIVLEDTLPDGLSFNAANSPGWSEVNGVLTFGPFDLPVGGEQIIGLGATLGPNACGTYKNCVTVPNPGDVCPPPPACVSFEVEGSLEVFACASDVTCHGREDGSVFGAVFPPVGTPPFQYKWTDSSGDEIQPTNPPNIIRGVLAPGSYTLEVTDARGCKGSDDFVIQDPPPLQVDLGPDVALCGGQPVTLTANVSGGNPFPWGFRYSYSWSSSPVDPSLAGAQGPSVTVSPTVDTTYTVQVEDLSGCSATDAVEVKVGASDLTLTAEGFFARGCDRFDSEGTAIEMSVEGGTPPFIYDCELQKLATGLSGCRAKADEDLSSIPPLPSAPEQLRDYEPKGMPAGTYRCTVTDANGCAAPPQPVEIERAIELDFVCEPPTRPFCDNGSVTVAANGINCPSGVCPSNRCSECPTVGDLSGCLHYTLDNEIEQVTPVFTGVSQGAHTVTVTDCAGCFRQIEIELGCSQEPPPPPLTPSVELLLHGSWMAPGADFSTPGPEGLPVDVDFDDAFGLGLGIELSWSRRFSWLLEALIAEGDVETRSQVFDASGQPLISQRRTSSSLLLSLGLNVHLTPEQNFDLYVGPLLGYVDLADPPGFSVESDLGVGLILGADVPLASSRWRLGGSVRYLATDLKLTSEFLDEPISLGLDSFITSFGFSFRLK